MNEKVDRLEYMLPSSADEMEARKVAKTLMLFNPFFQNYLQESYAFFDDEDHWSFILFFFPQAEVPQNFSITMELKTSSTLVNNSILTFWVVFRVGR